MNIKNNLNLKNKCTGCLACYNICPKKAIILQKSDDGFLFPNVETEICVDCGLCANVCHLMHDSEKCITEEEKCFYQGYATDPTVRVSGSSGGIFELLSRHILSMNGVVFGAVFDVGKKYVCHMSTVQTDLNNMLRSKYVQSYIGDCYKSVANFLSEGRWVLFSGTPCQIRGLKSYLSVKGIEGNLITVDFFCHGVPSPMFFKHFLNKIEKQKNSKIIDCTFREKDYGWHKQSIKIYLENGEVWSKLSCKCFYYYYFLKNYSLRDSCYSCKEYCNHLSDITLADYWQISSYEDDDLGMSLIITNTIKGKKILMDISTSINVKSLESTKFNFEYYSHKKYNYKNKECWLNIYKRKGFNALRTWYYNFIKLRDDTLKFIKYIGGSFIRLLKKIKNKG